MPGWFAFGACGNALAIHANRVKDGDAARGARAEAVQKFEVAIGINADNAALKFDFAQLLFAVALSRRGDVSDACARACEMLEASDQMKPESAGIALVKVTL